MRFLEPSFSPINYFECIRDFTHHEDVRYVLFDPFQVGGPRRISVPALLYLRRGGHSGPSPIVLRSEVRPR